MTGLFAAKWTKKLKKIGYARLRRIVQSLRVSNPESHSKMHLLNDLIKPTVMRYSMHTYLKTSGRYVKLQKTGSRFTTKKDNTVPLAEYRLETIEQRQKTTL